MIKLIVDAYGTPVSRSGTSYHALMVRDVATGQSVSGNLGGSARGQARHIARELGYDWDELHVSEIELPARQFDRLVKGWPWMTSADDVRRAFAALGVTLTPPARRGGKPRRSKASFRAELIRHGVDPDEMVARALGEELPPALTPKEQFRRSLIRHGINPDEMVDRALGRGRAGGKVRTARGGDLADAIKKLTR